MGICLPTLAQVASLIANRTAANRELPPICVGDRFYIYAGRQRPYAAQSPLRSQLFYTPRLVATVMSMFPCMTGARGDCSFAVSHDTRLALPVFIEFCVFHVLRTARIR